MMKMNAIKAKETILKKFTVELFPVF